jgi:DNA polymerase-1
MYEWTHKEIKTHAEWNAMKSCFRRIEPTIGGFDTETTGLHIINDRPFIFQFGFLDDTSQKGYAYCIDLERTPLAMPMVKEWHLQFAPRLERYMAHNITYDLHMLKNIGIEYRHENMVDTMAYIRYAGDSIQVDQGGVPLNLKMFAQRYIDPSSKMHEKLLKQEKTSRMKAYNAELKDKYYGIVTKEERQEINDILSKTTFEIEDLPRFLQSLYREWYDSLPEWLRVNTVGYVDSDSIRYDTLDRERVKEYASMDIQLLLETYLHCEPIVKARKNQNAVDIEQKMVLPCLDMERAGLRIDKDYLMASKERMRSYIKQKYNKLYELFGTRLTTGQHQIIKKLLAERWGVKLEATNKDALREAHDSMPKQCKEAITLLGELRTLDKWYSVYILKYIRELGNGDRIYTQINSVGAVSGRFSSDFQQFPKSAILDDEGNELFHPRRMVLVESDRGFGRMAFIDYSQIELRLQAMYTILCGDPDLNMCRAYMPYKCIHSELGSFDCNNPEHLKRWNEQWRLEEDMSQIWKPTDIHGVTTKNALGIDESHPDWKLERSRVGKVLNFMKNYGGSIKVVMKMFPEKDKDELQKIDEAYYKSFPGVKTFHKYCYTRAKYNPSTTNLFGVQYYNVSGHKLINLLVQGSAAFLLKKAIRSIWEFLRDNPEIKSELVMCIHDELLFSIHDDDPEFLLTRFKNIMEDYEESLVPIVAEIDITETTWNEKHLYKTSEL